VDPERGNGQAHRHGTDNAAAADRHHDGEAVRYLTMWHSTYLWLALLIATSLAKNGRTACKQHLILLLAAFTLYRLSA